MFKLISLLLFSSILMAEASSITQQFHAVDTATDELLSSFDSIKKKREQQAAEEAKEKKVQEKKEAALLAEKNKLEFEARLDKMRQNALRQTQREEEKQKAAQLKRESEALKQAEPKKEKVRKQQAQQRKMKQQTQARERWIKKEKARKKAEAKKKRELAQANTVVKPKPKKRLTQDHLNAVLGQN